VTDPISGWPTFVCPHCRGRLQQTDDALSCTACERLYPIREEVPVLVFDQSSATHDDLDHIDRAQGKARQAKYFDEERATAFELTRPHGAPRLYAWFLHEKFRRATEPIRSWLGGSTVLVVCGGSGMDAEFLARTGARVTSSDISLGAAQRARQRAHRFDIELVSIVADVENLPLPDMSTDVVYVHDGLHHLDDPDTAVREMCRVARRAVLVSEPARALLTSAAVRLGYALEREESGNRVGRMDPRHLASLLATQSFRVVKSQRYLMYYRHEPGRAFAVLSRPLVFQLAVFAWRCLNAVLGRAGNKIAMVAIRKGVTPT
jgi:SAM-dependent methyltransferase